ncbi:MAG: aconitase family protein [Polyangiaceae bacterium]
MAQKILAGRASDPTLQGELVSVKVDQVVLSRAPALALAEGLHAGLKKTNVEVAIAYDGRAITSAEDHGKPGTETPVEFVAHGVLLARAGIGYPNAVHLERFASPARLCVTDDPRLAGVGGVGMLSLVLAPAQLGQALAQGSVLLRPPRSIQVLLSGRVRPFVCARDIALELIRRGLGEAIGKVERAHAAPVVVEFAGPSVRLLSVSERAVLAGLAPQLGAAAAIFTSDERSEVFLRDQRRSKAHRALVPDAGAPCDDVLNVDLGAVDPLLLDDAGNVRSVRDLAGKPVSQVVLGGDSGVTLRDMLAAATLLKSKRVPPRLDFVVAVPSRQMLEVLASTGALTDLVATGARIVEPDRRVMTGELYPPVAGGESLRSYDPEPRAGGHGSFVVASAETLAYAVASGEIGDPRAFKRPVRVTVPRALPTDDVLVVREKKALDVAKKDKVTFAVLPSQPWKGGALDVVDGALRFVRPKAESVVVCATLDEVRRAALVASDPTSGVRAVVGTFVPSGTVSWLAGLGVATFEADASAVAALRAQKTLTLPALAAWEDGTISASAGSSKVTLKALVRTVERAWVTVGTARVAPPPAKSSRRAL